MQSAEDGPCPILGTSHCHLPLTVASNVNRLKVLSTPITVLPDLPLSWQQNRRISEISFHLECDFLKQ